MPELEVAVARNVRVDTIWRLVIDEEDLAARRPITLSQDVLAELSPRARQRVILSSSSSSSHLKAVLSDACPEGWETLIGSCNALSAKFDLVEISVRLK